MGDTAASNFGHLKAHDEQLVRLGLLAERYFPEDPNKCLLKLRQLTEALAQLAASRVGIYAGPEEKQAELLRRLQDSRHPATRGQSAPSFTRFARPATKPITSSRATIASRSWRCGSPGS